MTDTLYAAALPSVDNIGNKVVDAAGTCLIVAFIVGALIFGLGQKWGKMGSLIALATFCAGLIFIPNGAKNFLVELANNVWGGTQA